MDSVVLHQGQSWLRFLRVSRVWRRGGSSAHTRTGPHEKTCDMRGSLVPGSSSLSVVSPRRFATGDRGGFRVFFCRAGPPRNGMCDVASSCGTSTRPRRDAGLSRCVNIKSHVKYDAVASPRVGVAASRAAGTFPARPAGSCAVPPRVACAAAAASTAAVGPGVVTAPPARGATRRTAMRRMPLAGRRAAARGVPEAAPARPRRSTRRSVSSTVCVS